MSKYIYEIESEDTKIKTKVEIEYNHRTTREMLNKELSKAVNGQKYRIISMQKIGEREEER